MKKIIAIVVVNLLVAGGLSARAGWMIMSGCNIDGTCRGSPDMATWGLAIGPIALCLVVLGLSVPKLLASMADRRAEKRELKAEKAALAESLGDEAEQGQSRLARLKRMTVDDRLLDDDAESLLDSDDQDLAHVDEAPRAAGTAAVDHSSFDHGQAAPLYEDVQPALAQPVAVDDSQQWDHADDAAMELGYDQRSADEGVAESVVVTNTPIALEVGESPVILGVNSLVDTGNEAELDASMEKGPAWHIDPVGFGEPVEAARASWSIESLGLELDDECTAAKEENTADIEPVSSVDEWAVDGLSHDLPPIDLPTFGRAPDEWTWLFADGLPLLRTSRATGFPWIAGGIGEVGKAIQSSVDLRGVGEFEAETDAWVRIARSMPYAEAIEGEDAQAFVDWCNTLAVDLAATNQQDALCRAIAVAMDALRDRAGSDMETAFVLPQGFDMPHAGSSFGHSLSA